VSDRHRLADTLVASHVETAAPLSGPGVHGTIAIFRSSVARLLPDRVFERYLLSEKPLLGALTEIYVQGVSTRKVKAITEELHGREVSASNISRRNELEQELDRA